MRTDPSPRPSPSIALPDSNPEGSGGNHGGQSSSDRSLSGNKDGLTLQSVYDLCISLCTQVSAQAKEIKALKAQVKKLKKGVKPLIHITKPGGRREESVKSSKGEPSVHKDLAFDDLDDDAMDYMETKDAQDEGRTSSVVLEEKESANKEVRLLTAPWVVTVSQDEASSTIDPKDKGKKDEIDEEDEAQGGKKGSERIGSCEEKDKARIMAIQILVEELQKEEREKFTIEQRAKFLHDTIAAQRKFLAQQRSEAIRNKPPTRNQLRNQMMTYLKHVGGKKHSDLKTKTFEEIQVLYERLKRQDQNFVAIGSTKDERQIKELNKDPKKKRVIKETLREEDTTKVPAEQEVTEQGTKKRKSGHVKMLARKRPRPQPDDGSDDEHRKCLRIVTFDSTIDSEIVTPLFLYISAEGSFGVLRHIITTQA
ncbi:hypothetical protein Tco_0027127 [Tanacetum coccineum]